MHWMFPCLEGISLVGLQSLQGPPYRGIAGLDPLHKQVITLLGASREKLSQVNA